MEYHAKLHLKLLSERRKIFMLVLMNKVSRISDNVNNRKPERQLRTGPKVKMKSSFTDKERVLRSPYYKCIRLWDKLDSHIQLSENIFEFKMKLKKVDIAGLWTGGDVYYIRQYLLWLYNLII